MSIIKRFGQFVLATALVFGIPIVGANAAPDGDQETILVNVRGFPGVYCPVPEGQWPIITTLELPANATFADAKPLLPEPLAAPGYNFSDFYSMNRGGTGNLIYHDDTPLVYPSGRVREIFFPYQMRPAVFYDTQGADNATDPAFASYNAAEYNNAIMFNPAPETTPVKTNPELGRSGDTFTGWFEDQAATTPFNFSQSILRYYKSIGSPKETMARPGFPDCTLDVRLLRIYAGWDEAPLLDVQDVTITEGQPVDAQDFVVSATDKEDGTPSVELVSNVDNLGPGDYTVILVATDSVGGTHEQSATLTVLPAPAKINKAPTLEVKPVTITAGDPFQQSDLVVSAHDEEDGANGMLPALSYAGAYDSKVPGVYQITITATDSQGAKVSKTATLTVVAAEKPGKPVEPNQPADPGKPADPLAPGKQTPPAKSGGSGLPSTGAADSAAIALSGLALCALGALAMRRKNA